MSKHICMFERLIAQGFQIEFHSHARAILGADFADAVAELEEALIGTTIPIEEIIAGGGGEAKGTQRLRRALTLAKWPKFTFVIVKTINGTPTTSDSFTTVPKSQPIQSFVIGREAESGRSI